MSSLANRRQKVIKIIRTQQRERIFKKIRQRKLQMNNEDAIYDEEQENDLHILMKRSLIKNQLLLDIRQNNLLMMLKDRINHINNIREFQYILSIFTNLLGDSLNLDQQQQIAQILINIYHIELFQLQFNSNHYNLSLFRTVLSNLIAYNSILHFIEENIAMKCQSLMLNLIQEIFIKIVSVRQANQLQVDQRSLLEKISTLLVEFFQKFFYSQPQYITSIPYKFFRNINIFQKILHSHKIISKLTSKTHHLKIIHQGLMIVYQLLSQNLKTSDFPLFFEDAQFLMLPFDEIIISESAINCKISLHLITNILSNYLESGLFALLDSIKQAFTVEKRQILFKKLLQNDVNSYFKLNLLKFMLLQEQFYIFFEDIFQKYWKQLVDSCIQILNAMDDLQDIKLALEVMIHVGCKKCGCNLIQYLISIGAKTLIQHLMIKQYELFPSSNQELLEDVNNLASYLLLFQK